jgi:VanZ family protein
MRQFDIKPEPESVKRFIDLDKEGIPQMQKIFHFPTANKNRENLQWSTFLSYFDGIKCTLEAQFIMQLCF